MNIRLRRKTTAAQELPIDCKEKPQLRKDLVLNAWEQALGEGIFGESLGRAAMPMHEAKVLFPDEPVPELPDDPVPQAQDADEDKAAVAMLNVLEETHNELAPTGPISADQHQPTPAEQIDRIGKEVARMTLPPSRGRGRGRGRAGRPPSGRGRLPG